MTRLPSGGKDWVPIAPVRAHVQGLRDEGLPVSAIARAAHVSPGTVFNLMITWPTKQAPKVRHRLLRSTAAALLALTPEIVRGQVDPVPVDVVDRALWTPAERVRQHIRVLQESGMNVELIAKQSNVTSRHLVAINATNPDVSQAITHERVSTSVARRILAVKPGLRSPHKSVDAAPTNRRLQAMLVAGYTYSMIGAMIGSAGRFVRPKVTQAEVRVEFAERVARAYSAHAFSPPRYADASSRSHGQRLAVAARDRGWLSPFEWDDIDTGTRLEAPQLDVEAVDDIDQVAVDLAVADCLAGMDQSPVLRRLTRPEKDVAMERLLRHGVSYAEVARRLRVSDRRAADMHRDLQGDRHESDARVEQEEAA